MEARFGTLYMSADAKSERQVFRTGPVAERFCHVGHRMQRSRTDGHATPVATGNPSSVVVSEATQTCTARETPHGGMNIDFGNGILSAATATRFVTSEDELTRVAVRPAADFTVRGYVEADSRTVPRPLRKSEKV